MLEPFFEYLEFERRYSKHTLVSYRKDIEQFTDFLSNRIGAKIAEAEFNDIRGWVSHLAENKVAHSSIARKLASIRALYKFLVAEEVIDQSPAAKVKAPKVKKRVPVFVHEEKLLRLLDNITFEDNFEGHRDKLVLELLYGTGLRLSELQSLKRSDVDFFNKTIKVLGKRNKQRIVPLSEGLIQIIENYLKHRDELPSSPNEPNLLLVTAKKRPTYSMFVYRIVNKYLSQIEGIEKRSPHVLRHTFATHLLNHGADINAIKDILGHANLTATQVYTHNSLEKLKAAYKQAHPKA